MDFIINKDIKDSIKKDLDLEQKINEALVAQEKQFQVGNTEFLSKKNITNHKELYAQYIKDFNAISARLDTVNRDDASSNISAYRQLKIDETFNMNAAYLHELYFANIGDVHSKITMESLSFIRLERDFGSFDAWQKDFIACCKSSRCGWAVTYLNTYTQKYMNCVIDLHSNHVPAGFFPVVVMDVWQHAYYRDYVKDVKTYVFAMMKELNWEVIESRFQRAERIAKVLRS